MNRIALTLTLATSLVSFTTHAQDKTIQVDTVLTYDNVRYEGQWPEGKGVLYSLKEGLIIGTFRDGLPEGKCINWEPDGDRYWGDFREGRRDGHGCLFRDRNIVVTGEFMDGEQHGRDTVYRADGTVMIGMYENGRFIKSIKEFEKPNTKLLNAKPSFPKVSRTDEQLDFCTEIYTLYREEKVRNMAEKKNSNEVKPMFMGKSANEFSTWVNSQLEYPAKAKDLEITGCAVLQFEIDIEGKVKNVRLLKSAGHYSLDDEALRVVRMSPDWNPGTQDGVAKEMTVTFPVIFKSNKEY